ERQPAAHSHPSEHRCSQVLAGTGRRGWLSQPLLRLLCQTGYRRPRISSSILWDREPVDRIRRTSLRSSPTRSYQDPGVDTARRHSGAAGLHAVTVTQIWWASGDRNGSPVTTLIRDCPGAAPRNSTTLGAPAGVRTEPSVPRVLSM